MDARRWHRITRIFENALGLAHEDRTAYLDEVCSGDAELRRDVEGLLDADAGAEGFLDEPPAKPAPSPPAPERIGRYEILGKIGEGGFGAVYLGRDGTSRVAIKTCLWNDPAVRRRFQREAEIAGRLRHENVTVVYGAGEEGDLSYLVEEYLEGEDLTAAIGERRPLALEERLEILRQAAHGLEYAHVCGVVHRDVKPSNLRLLPDGRVKVMDFGVAKLRGAKSRLTRTGATPGTLAYMAPEQLRGETVDGRADLFAFGVVAYELLSYRHPFPGDTDAAVLFRILDSDPEPLTKAAPGCPPRLARLVGRCLEKDPEKRFPDFTALLAELERVRLEASGDRAAPPVPSRIVRWAAAAVLLAALAGFGGWLAGLYTTRRPGTELPVPAAARTGSLVLRPVPWAEVLSVTDAEGHNHSPKTPLSTPWVLALPPGEYTVTLSHPRLSEPYRCRVELDAGATAECRDVLVRLDAHDFFAEVPW